MSTRRAAEDAPRVEPADRAAWRAWLAAHHAQDGAVWLVLRKGEGAGLTQDAAIEEALCFGWIDSLPRKLDAERWMLLVSPRRPGSPWSRVNKARVERLAAAGRMAPPGVARIADAKADGSWTIYDTAEALAEPPELVAALAAAEGARAAWDGFAPSARKGILWWIASARTEATRARRIAETARLASLGLRANFPESRGR
jgi:uncharacterized protein YdeI (YjbR/CyaY-like superfamily)